MDGGMEGLRSDIWYKPEDRLWYNICDMFQEINDMLDIVHPFNGETAPDALIQYAPILEELNE